MAVMIINDIGRINAYGWDYPLEDLEYLVRERNDEVFVICNNRLFETEESILLEP